ncbi:MAG TPA: type VI secretion system accessory protein TagJ [Bryobacteraceae bacterium]|nr:type VI secretion system accessory protein TagJ [Bryobacteraceae bacterium]
MNAKELFQAGKLTEAVQALGAELRENPTDAKRRTFLFELLCFAGDYDRAEKHLGVLAQASPTSEMGGLLYRGVLAAERARQETFDKREYNMMPPVDAAPLTGTLNGKPFTSLTDADGRIGPRLETFSAGTYLWLPFAHIASIRIDPPRRLRDLLWLPAKVLTGPAFQGTELGELLIPVLSPLSWRNPDEEVRLGRVTVWEEGEDGEEVPFGQKMLLVDGEEIPLLEVRSLTVNATPAEAAETN